MTNSVGPDTDALLVLAGRGDVVARSQLLERHRDRLRRMVAVRLEQRLSPQVDPSDVIQEALAEADQKLPRIRREPTRDERDGWAWPGGPSRRPLGERRASARRVLPPEQIMAG